MNKQEIESLLIERAKLNAEVAQFRNGYDLMRKKLIPEEIQKQLNEVDAEETQALNGLVVKLAELESSIKNETIALGETVSVKGVGQAVFNRGRVSWNTDGLDGLMVAVPQLAQFRKQGEPYITLK